MHRLEAVAHIRQRARHDHAHRVIEIAALHLVGDRDGLDIGGTRVPRFGSIVVGQVLKSGQIAARFCSRFKTPRHDKAADVPSVFQWVNQVFNSDFPRSQVRSFAALDLTAHGTAQLASAYMPMRIRCLRIGDAARRGRPGWAGADLYRRHRRGCLLPRDAASRCAPALSPRSCSPAPR